MSDAMPDAMPDKSEGVRTGGPELVRGALAQQADREGGEADPNNGADPALAELEPDERLDDRALELAAVGVGQPAAEN